MDKNRPVKIRVTVYGRYVMLDPPTIRNAYLMAILKDEGGINASVDPGDYYFNVLKKPSGVVLNLTRA